MKTEVFGIKEMNKVLEELAPKHARALSRNTIRGLAARVVKEAKKRVVTKSGKLKKGIKAKNRRSTPDKPISDVVVNGGKTKGDPFYWRFVEYGTGGPVPQPEQPFLRPAKDLVTANMSKILKEEFTKKLASAIKREQKKARK